MSASTATLNAVITNCGNALSLDYGFMYSSDQLDWMKVSVGNNIYTGGYSVDLSSLTAGVTYYVYAYDTNSAGTGYGSTLNFTTPPSTPVVISGVAPNPVTLVAGYTQQLTTTVAPTDAAVGYVSGNTGAATVSASGLVTAVASGTANITATATEAGYADATPVTVPVTVYARGDVNLDGNINIADIVAAVNIATNPAPDPSSLQFKAADLNKDGVVNILDIVALVNMITASI